MTVCLLLINSANQMSNQNPRSHSMHASTHSGPQTAKSGSLEFPPSSSISQLFFVNRSVFFHLFPPLLRRPRFSISQLFFVNSSVVVATTFNDFATYFSGGFFMKRGGPLFQICPAFTAQSNVLVVVAQSVQLKIFNEIQFSRSFPNWLVSLALDFFRQSLNLLLLTQQAFSHCRMFQSNEVA